MFNTRALTKIQSIILVVVIVVAAVGGVVYFLLGGGNQFETIKIGVLANLDGYWGKNVIQGVKLAAEQLNDEGGILGRQVEVIMEESYGGASPALLSTALHWQQAL